MNKITTLILFAFIIAIFSLTTISATDTQPNDVNNTFQENTQNTQNTQTVDVEVNSREISKKYENENIKEASSTLKITSNNYKDYFQNENGTLKTTDIIKKGDTLNLQGNFNNLSFIADKENLVITSIGKNAKLFDCSIYLQASNTKVSNMTINNSKDNCEAIILDTISNARVTDNRVTANGTNGFILTAYEIANCTISGNYFESNHLQSNMRIYSSNNNTITNNTIIGNANGIYLCAYDGSPSNNNRITYNTVIGKVETSVCYTIQLMGNDNIVEYNTVYGGYRGISSEDSNIIRNNDVDAVFAGIFTGKNSTIENNNIHVSKDSYGIMVSGNQSIIRNNTITANDTGILIDNDNITIYNNTINSKLYGIYSKKSGKGFNGINVTKNTIIGQIYNTGSMTLDKNNITNSNVKEGGAIYNTGNIIITNNTFTNNTAENGAIIYRKRGTVTASDNTFIENTPESFILHDGKIILNDTGNFIPVNAEVTIYEKTRMIKTNMINSTINYTVPVGNHIYSLIITNNTTSFDNNNFTINVNQVEPKNNTNIYIYPRSGDSKGTTIKVSGKLQSNGEGIKGEKVNISVNGKSYTATTGGYGYFTVQYTITSYDNLTVTMSYAGSDSYEASKNTTIYTIKQATNMYIYPRSGDTKGSTIKVSGKLQTDGEGIKGEKVNINVNGKTYTATTGGYGYFTVQYAITSYDNLTVTMSYNGNSKYEATSNTTTYSVKQESNIYMYTRSGDKKGSTIKVSGKLQTNGEGIRGEKVTINVNGKSYTATTGGYGYFTVNHTITSYDNLNVTFTYAGNKNYEASTNSTVYKVNPQTTLFIYSRTGDTKGSTIKVSGKLLCDGEGVKGEKITINVNGKTYTATTGGYGYFTVKHTITTYDNLTVSMSYAGSSKYEATSNQTVYTVKQPTNIYMYTRSNDKVGSTIKVSGKLQNNGEGIKGEKVKINVNGKTYTATTGGYGYFTVKYTITKNENLNVTFTYDGSKLYEKSTNTTIYTVKA